MSKSLVPVEPVNFAVTLPDKQEIMEIMQENLGEGIPFSFERVKMPSGGGLAWEVTDEDGNSDSVKELVGIILDHHPANGYWKEKFSGKNQPPDCSSMDGITGTDNQGKQRSCATCPMNQFGSDPEGGNGKACKNMHRVYLVREGEVFPLLITLPPTSLGNFKDFVRRLTNKLKKLTTVVSKVTLEKDKNDGGIVYSKAVFSRLGDLDKAVAHQMSEHAKVLKPYLRQIKLTDEDYNAPAQGNDGDSVSDAQFDEAMGFNGQTVDVPGTEENKAW